MAGRNLVMNKLEEIYESLIKQKKLNVRTLIIIL